jgi:hypothetical protein
LHEKTKNESNDSPLLDQDYHTDLMYGVYLKFQKSKRMSRFELKMRESEYKRYRRTK